MGRKGDKYSRSLTIILKKLSKNVSIHFSENINEKVKRNIFKVPNYWYDYIICYRSFYILTKNEIKKSKLGAINFHPGPPEYRGIGCVNYALYDNVKVYGTTAHLISKKIDKGKIINVKKIKVYKNDNVDTLLKRTYFIQYNQAKKIIKLLSQNYKNLNYLINQSKKEKWSSKIKKRKELDKFYEIKKSVSKIELERKIRSTLTRNYKPYIIIHKKKFSIDF